MAGSNTRGSSKAADDKAKDDIARPKGESNVPVAIAPTPDNPVSVIAAAMLGVMQAVFNVEKNGTNEHFKYSYTTEADLLARIRPEMIKQGLILVPDCEELRATDASGNVFIVMSYTLAHVSGAVWPYKVRAPGAGNDKSARGGNGDKGVYKALTGANKYLLLKLFQIATGNDDPETADLGHVNDTAGGVRGAQQQRQGGGQQANRPKMLSLREEDEFRAIFVNDLKRARSRDDMRALFDDKACDMIERCSKRTKDEIDKTKRERWAALGSGGSGERRGERRDEGRDRRDDVPVTSGDQLGRGGTDDVWPPEDEHGDGDGQGMYGSDDGDNDGEHDGPPL